MESKIVDRIEVRQVPDFPRYWISSHGDVWFECNAKERYWVKSHLDKDGFATLSMYSVNKFGKRFGSKKRLHRIVALCWIGPLPFEEAQVLHRDDNHEDNSVLNLRYGTHLDNMSDRSKNGGVAKGERNGSSTVTEATALEVRRRLDLGQRPYRIAREMNISSKMTYSMAHGTNWTHIPSNT